MNWVIVKSPIDLNFIKINAKQFSRYLDLNSESCYLLLIFFMHRTNLKINVNFFFDLMEWVQNINFVIVAVINLANDFKGLNQIFYLGITYILFSSSYHLLEL